MKPAKCLVGVGILGLVISGCTSDSGLSGSVLLAPKTYGSGPDGFVISFSRAPTNLGERHTPTTPPTTTRTSTPPPSTDSRLNGFGGAVNVSVITDSAVRPHQLESELRSYLPFATRGRMYLFNGMPAIKEVVDCSIPAGPCPGKTAGLEVLDGSTLFDVFVSGLNAAGTDQALSSFRVASVARTPGCSYRVNRKGFTQQCATKRQVVIG
jgi:hypothetical protein